jgi:predicted enzyme related to lactoylglutathione lyase
MASGHLRRNDGGVEVSSVTVGLPVGDLGRAVRWYQEVFGLGEPDLAPADGVLEFQVGPVWLQLSAASPAPSATGTVTRFGVPDAGAERIRLARLGVAVGPLEHVPGAVDYFDFTDPDGNRLSLYSFPSQ